MNQRPYRGHRNGSYYSHRGGGYNSKYHNTQNEGYNDPRNKVQAVEIDSSPPFSIINSRTNNTQNNPNSNPVNINEPFNQEDNKNQNSQVDQVAKNINNEANSAANPNNEASINTKKILCYPGETYPMNEKIFTNSIFNVNQGNIITKKTALIQLYEPKEDKEKQENNENNEAKDTSNLNSNTNSANPPIQASLSSKTLTKFYIPKKDDIILGIVTQKFSECYKIELDSYSSGILHKINTEGNKNSKLDANPGDLILCKVLAIHHYDNTTLTSEKKELKKKLCKVYCDGELGKLEEGNLYNVDINDVEKLNVKNPVIKKVKSLRPDCVIVASNNGKLFIKDEKVLICDAVYDMIIRNLKGEQFKETKIIDIFNSCLAKN